MCGQMKVHQSGCSGCHCTKLISSSRCRVMVSVCWFSIAYLCRGPWLTCPLFSPMMGSLVTFSTGLPQDGTVCLLQSGLQGALQPPHKLVEEHAASTMTANGAYSCYPYPGTPYPRSFSHSLLTYPPTSLPPVGFPLPLDLPLFCTTS